MARTARQDKEFGDEFLDQIIDWVGDNLDPEDVFSDATLEEWAVKNGYVLE